MIKINNIEIGRNKPLVLIAGPCQIESLDHAELMAGSIKEIAQRLGIPFIYKSSFDKANRSSLNGKRGIGLDLGLKILNSIKKLPKKSLSFTFSYIFNDNKLN